METGSGLLGNILEYSPSWPGNLAVIHISPMFASSSWSLTETFSLVELAS